MRATFDRWAEALLWRAAVFGWACLVVTGLYGSPPRHRNGRP